MLWAWGIGEKRVGKGQGHVLNDLLKSDVIFFSETGTPWERVDMARSLDHVRS